MLWIAYPKKDFIVWKNSCKEGLGGVLMQEGWVVCYESRKVNENEQNYVSHELDLTAIIHAFKMWRHYILVWIFALMTDHGGLKYLFDRPKLNARWDRWLATLDEFGFEIKYIKYKENTMVDALIRRVKINHIAVISSYGTDLEETIKNAGHVE